MRVTISDVAKAAGVSTSTVSRVIHDNPRISDMTKKRVREAMEQLDYYPNALASGLARSCTSNLGLILPNSSKDLFVNPFFIQAVRGIGIKAQAQGYNLMFSFSNNENEEVDFIKNYIESRWVDGIVLFTARDNDHCISYLRGKRFPFVVIGRPHEIDDLFWVDNDNFEAMYNVVNFLVSKGKRDIAFLGGPASMRVTQDRLCGYKQALQTRGIVFEPKLIKTAGEFSEEEGARCYGELLAEAKPDAVVTTDDFLAFGVMNYIRDNNLEDIAITGFNNTIRGEHQSPSLTSVEVKPKQLGMEAADMLIQYIRDPEIPPQNQIVSCHLIERSSTKA